MSGLPTETTPGYGRSTRPLAALFDQSHLPADQRFPRPAMVWFGPDDPNPKLARRMFDDESVAVAARYFDCVKIFTGDIEAKEDRERYCKSSPTIIFFDAGAKEVGRLSGEGFSKGDVYRMMQKAANVHFKKSLADLVSKYTEFLKRFDKVQGKVAEARDDVSFNEEHMVTHPCDRARKAIGEANAELATLEKDSEKLKAEEDALLKAELKADPFAASEPEPKKN